MCYCLWLISMVLIKGFVFTITACVCVSERGVQVVTMVVRGGEIPCLLLCNMAIKRP